MSDAFIALKCESCGGKLDVYPATDRFACGFCGTEMVVQRRGGTVALKLVQAAIQKVQVSTDKTAAELALARYQYELRELRERERRLANHSSVSVLKLLAGACAALFGLAWAADGGSLAPAIVGAVVAVIGFRGLGNNGLDRTRSKIDDLHKQIQEKKRVAES